MIEKDKQTNVSGLRNWPNDQTKVSFQISSDKSPIERMTKLTGEDLVTSEFLVGVGME